jgi:hypothetical protein
MFQGPKFKGSHPDNGLDTGVGAWEEREKSVLIWSWDGFHTHRYSLPKSVVDIRPNTKEEMQGKGYNKEYGEWEERPARGTYRVEWPSFITDIRYIRVPWFEFVEKCPQMAKQGLIRFNCDETLPDPKGEKEDFRAAQYLHSRSKSGKALDQWFLGKLTTCHNSESLQLYKNIIDEYGTTDDIYVITMEQRIDGQEETGRSWRSKSRRFLWVFVCGMKDHTIIARLKVAMDYNEDKGSSRPKTTWTVK